MLVKERLALPVLQILLADNFNVLLFRQFSSHIPKKLIWYTASCPTTLSIERSRARWFITRANQFLAAIKRLTVHHQTGHLRPRVASQTAKCEKKEN